jgi:hypothetical protein
MKWLADENFLIASFKLLVPKDWVVFKEGYRPIGVVYFRLPYFQPEAPAQILLNLKETGFHSFEFHFTVISDDGIRQRTISS